MSHKQTTHFGFKHVPSSDKAGLVREVFDSVANKYDLMNDLMSFGVHRLWKRITVGLSNVRSGDCVLDLAGGTGDLTSLYAPRVGERGQIILADINASMLWAGRDRLIDKGIVASIHYTQADAEHLPFKDNSFNCVCIAFGLRNVTDKDAALRSMYRVLAPGGRLVILEFSEPSGDLFKKIYDFHSFKLLPMIGRFIAKNADSYQYLAESIRMHPKQEKLKKMLERAGFERCEFFSLTKGIVAIHRGYKF